MKKLMMSAAIVCAAAFAQAAQYNWDASDICSGFESGFEMQNAKGTAYLFLNGGDTTISAIQSIVAGGTFLSDGWDGKALDFTSFDGMIATPKLSTEGLAGQTGDSFFAVFVADSWTPFDAGAGGKVDPMQAYVGTTFTPGEVKSIGPTTLTFGSQFDGSSVAGGWTANPASVPEPTSGLLLVLGMAGLALRRRRA